MLKIEAQTAPWLDMSAGDFAELDRRLPERLASDDLGASLVRSPRSEVYALGDRLVVKFYALSATRKEVMRQVDLARSVHAAGLPTPWTCARTVRHAEDGRIGVIIQRVTGLTPKDELRANPMAYKLTMRNLALDHRAVHQFRAVGGVPSQRERIERHIRQCIYLSEARKQAVLELLKALPDGDALCHGDFSWSNMIVGDSGRTIIDWTDAGLGSPVCDVARTWILLHFNAVWNSALARWFSARLSATYLKSYFDDEVPQEFRTWTIVNAALRLRDLHLEKFRWNRERLIRFIDRGIGRPSI